jgi:hypothetical protein
MALNEGIANAIIQALGIGPGHPYTGDAEGQVDFYCCGQANYMPTVLLSGADGTTTYTKISAVFVAPEATFVSTISLYGTTGGRNPGTRKQFAVEGSVDRSLEDGETYVVYWVIHGEL